MLRVTYKTKLENVDWAQMKETLHEDAFDNGRSPEQLKKSFEKSYATCIAYADNRIIGTARVLSDGVCNAYVATKKSINCIKDSRISASFGHSKGSKSL